MCTHERLAHLQLCLLSRKLFRVEMEGLQRGAGLIRCATALAALAALPCDLHFAHPEPLADKAEGPPCRLPVSVAICLPSTKEATKKGPCLRQGHEKHPEMLYASYSAVISGGMSFPAMVRPISTTI